MAETVAETGAPVADDYVVDAKRDRLVIVASTLGTVFEWYDFFIYGTLAAVIGRQFFPRSATRPRSSCSLWPRSASASACGRSARSCSAILGDKLGRKYTFLVTITLMGIATAAVGLLPTYAADRHRRADPARPASACCRGWRSAANMAARRSTSPSMRRRNKRGLYTSFIQAGVIGGFLLSVAVVLVSEWFVDREALGRLGLARSRSCSRSCCSRSRSGCG